MYTCTNYQWVLELFPTHLHVKILLHVQEGVAGGLSVKALDYGLKDPGFQSHLQQRFISLLGALSPTSKIE